VPYLPRESCESIQQGHFAKTKTAKNEWRMRPPPRGFVQVGLPEVLSQASSAMCSHCCRLPKPSVSNLPSNITMSIMLVALTKTSDFYKTKPISLLL
jgi:hypothetical protein